METPSDQQDQLLGSAAQNDDHAADGQDEGQHHEKEIATSKVSTGAMTDVALESLMQSAVYESVEELPASGKTEDAVLETGLTSATTQPGQPLCTSGIIETSQSHLPDQQVSEELLSSALYYPSLT